MLAILFEKKKEYITSSFLFFALSGRKTPLKGEAYRQRFSLNPTGEPQAFGKSVLKTVIVHLPCQGTR